ncbi:MAG: dihydroorotate dehydrogenase-like protein [Candidatus Omnitrophica bacterium]|nr:dihydroorotate dehydrogenase-like protein [Candidatus Omnitrophota bacterium]MCK5259687.1 dihydroorotate dehydrogenase-like protein [Candidatus Omnitrophota bacterium]
MDLSTTYMGLKLKNPVVISASPLSKSMDNYKRMQDAGAAAIVNHSLFEEQILKESAISEHFSNLGTDSFAESLTYIPETGAYALDPNEYVEHIGKAKKMVNIPVIGSLNGFSSGGWTKYAKRMEEAGADALELNIYFVPTDPSLSGERIEENYLEIFRSIKSTVKIPVAVKLSPFFSSIANMATKLDDAGADAVVLFNRFYQPDIDLENLEVTPNLILSTPHDIRLPLRWIAILYGQIKGSLAATSGIYDAQDVIKMIMVGADVTMLCSVLLKTGIEYVNDILKDMQEWMKVHQYESVQQMKGSMSQKSCQNPDSFERAHYMKILQSYQGVH